MVSVLKRSNGSKQPNPAYVRNCRPTPLSGIPDPAEIRRIVQLGKDRGLIRSTGDKATIERNGIDVSTMGPLRSQWIGVTPELAQRWLTNNFRNRPIREDVVRAYARDMASGHWVYTHQGIAFDDRDELIDGQHRLHAVILSGLDAVRMMVTFGLPSKIEGHEMTTMDAVDRGATRSVADQLKIQHGIKNGSVISSICSSIAPICCAERTRRLSVGQTLKIYRSFENAINWVIANRSRQIGLRQAGVMSGFAFAIATEPGHHIGSTPIKLMFESLVNGEVGNPRNGIAHLCAFLTSPEARLLTRGSDRALAELVLQAIYLQLQRKRLTTLKPSTEGADYFRNEQRDRVAKIRAIFELPGQAAKKKAA